MAGIAPDVQAGRTAGYAGFPGREAGFGTPGRGGRSRRHGVHRDLLMTRLGWSVACLMLADGLSRAGYRGWFHHHGRAAGSPHARAHTMTHMNRPTAWKPPGDRPLGNSAKCNPWHFGNDTQGRTLSGTVGVDHPDDPRDHS